MSNFLSKITSQSTEPKSALVEETTPTPVAEAPAAEAPVAKEETLSKPTEPVVVSPVASKDDQKQELERRRRRLMGY